MHTDVEKKQITDHTDYKRKIMFTVQYYYTSIYGVHRLVSKRNLSPPQIQLFVERDRDRLGNYETIFGSLKHLFGDIYRYYIQSNHRLFKCNFIYLFFCLLQFFIYDMNLLTVNRVWTRFTVMQNSLFLFSYSGS